MSVPPAGLPSCGGVRTSTASRKSLPTWAPSALLTLVAAVLRATSSSPRAERAESES